VILDWLPAAEVISEDDGIYQIRVKGYQECIDLWLRSQGDYIKNISNR
jgi:hypothetical protein